MPRKSYMSLSPAEFSKLCDKHHRNNKKLKALFNFAEYRREKTIYLLKAANEEFKKGFLEPEDEKYLEIKLKKLCLNANDWCYKTKWVKEKLTENKKPKATQLSFSFEKKSRTPQMTTSF